MKDKKAIDRAIELLDVVAKFVAENPLAEDCSVFYDGVECDGWCLAADCLSAAEALRGMK